MTTTHTAILHGDCRFELAKLPPNSVDAIVTDPPYELGFMGKGWDRSGVAFDVNTWAVVLRALKPGGHMLAFGGTRTYHRMVCAIEDAGFEIRDQLAWMYGTGFPKSLDVSKELDKREGHWRGRAGAVSSGNTAMGGPNYERTDKGDPITAAAAAWSGWGTALKPAQEPIVLARKPFAGTVAANVLAHGMGALNIDACRIGDGGGGRWPANVILDEVAATALDEQSTGASRFFYVAKASRSEREAGLAEAGLPVRSGGELTDREDGSDGLSSPRSGAGRKGDRRNTHPTVKPIALMRYLIRMITPPGGVVLDPFAGSGSTICAAVLEGRHAIGCELTEEYLPLIHARIEAARKGLL